METNKIYENFLGKKVKIILNVRGNLIVYHGCLLEVSKENVLLDDRYKGQILINKSDVSQILLNGGFGK